MTCKSRDVPCKKTYSFTFRVFNNAGTFNQLNDRIKTIEPNLIMEQYNTNTLGAVRVTKALLPLLSTSEFPVVANMSSFWGTTTSPLTDLASCQLIPKTAIGGLSYGYRMSKAAINMFTCLLAQDHPELCCIVTDPTWVQTGKASFIIVDSYLPRYGKQWRKNCVG